MQSAYRLTSGQGLPTVHPRPWHIIALICATALAIRLFRLGDWSLWLDEEASIYMSQNLGKPFARSALLYFQMLHGWFSLTGISVWAGRAVSVAFGVATIGVMATAFRRHVSQTTALLAAAFLTVNLGHVYWCQNVRYYVFTLFFETVSIAFFLDGFEQSRIRSLIFANVMWICGLGCHLTAALLAPIFWVYLACVAFWVRPAPYRRRDYIVFLVCQLTILLAMAAGVLSARASSLDTLGVTTRMTLFRAIDAGWFLKLLITVAAYFGLPIVVLGMSALFLKTSSASRMKLFFAICALVPLLELMVIQQLHLIYLPVWYYGFVSVVGFCFLAAMAIESLITHGQRRLALLLAVLSFVYYGAFLVYYMGSMYGDRPRWEEATRFLEQNVEGSPLDEEAVKVWSTAPNVVEFYLGVSPSETMHLIRVQPLIFDPPELPDIPAWYLADEVRTQPAIEAWLEENCELKAEFKAHSGPRDRSIRIYYRD